MLAKVATLWVLKVGVGLACLAAGAFASENAGRVIAFETRIDVAAEGYTVHRNFEAVLGADDLLNGVTLSFNPARETLTLRRAQLKQGDTEKALSHRLLMAEPNAPLHCVTIDLSDAQVGDRLTWEASWAVREHAMPGVFAHQFPARLTGAAENMRTQITLPYGTALTIGDTHEDIMPSVKPTAAGITYTWEAGEAQSHTDDSMVTVSTLSSWQQVGEWAEALFDVDQTLPQAAHNKLSEWRALPRADAITQAIRFVQDDIQYKTRAQITTHDQPQPPAATLATGLGDCKDQSALLVALLRALGVEATVALTHISASGTLVTAVPSPLAFNHAIVRITEGQHTVYVDPTVQLSGGVFPGLAPPPAEAVLPAARGASLTSLPKQKEEPNVTTRETLSTVAPLGAVTARSKIIFQGAAAEAERRALVRTPIDARPAFFHDLYRERVPGTVMTAPLRVVDDRDANILTITEEYAVPAAAGTLAIGTSWIIEDAGGERRIPRTVTVVNSGAATPTYGALGAAR